MVVPMGTFNVSAAELTPPASVNCIEKSKKITMEGKLSSGLPNDVSVDFITGPSNAPNDAKGLYDDPNGTPEKTMKGEYDTSDKKHLIANNTKDHKKLFWDVNGNTNLMMSVNGSNRQVLLKLDKSACNNINGFDALKIRYRVMQQSYRTATNSYTQSGYKPDNVSINIGLNMKNMNGSVAKTSGKYSLKPGADKIIEQNKDNVEAYKDKPIQEVIIPASAFYTTDVPNFETGWQSNADSYIVLVLTNPTGRYTYLFDDFEFIWYKPSIKIDSLSLSNDNTLTAGANTMTVNVSNPSDAAVDGAKLVLALYEKTSGMLVGADYTDAALGASETAERSLTVNIADISSGDYEVRLYAVDDFENLSPLTEVYALDENGEIAQLR